MSTAFAADFLDSGSMDQSIVLTPSASYAVGLVWRRLTPGGARADIKVGSQSAGSDLYCKIRGEEIAGFGARNRGHRKDVPVLVGVLDEVLQGGNWLAVFPLGEGEGYYIGAISGGNVLADGVFSVREAEAHAGRILHTAGGQWTAIVAPLAFGFHDARNEDLATVVGKVKKPRLKPVATNGKKIVLAVLALAICGAGFGYNEYLKRVAAEEEALLQQQLEASLQPGKPKVEIPPAPWVVGAQVQGGKVLRACSSAISERILVVAGWQGGNIVCTSSGVTQSLTRKPLKSGGAPLTWIRDSIEASGVKATVSPQGGDVAAINWSLEKPLEPIPAKVPKVSLTDAKRFLLTSFEHAFLGIEFGRMEQTPFYLSQDFAFDTRYDPAVLGEVLDLIPTLSVKSVEFNSAEGSYKVAGVFHEALEVDPNAVR